VTTEAAVGPSTEEFVGRVFDAGLKAVELTSMYIGDKLGLYQALSESGPVTSAELAHKTRLNERYLREWLEQQAVASVLAVDDASLSAEKRRFTLPPEHAAALIDPDSPFSIAPLARTVVVFGGLVSQVAEAFKTGGGVPWEAFGPEAVDIQGDFNRPWLLASLGNEYLPAIPEVHARLQQPGAKVLDLACGVGWASIAIAQAYPNAEVTGVDVDKTSIERARENATQAGVSGRVRFEAQDGAGLSEGGPYDFAIIVEAVHDMSNPVGVLSAVRKSIAPGASLIVVDEKVADSFTAPGDEIERFMYAASVLICLPAGMSEQPSVPPARPTAARLRDCSTYPSQLPPLQTPDAENDQRGDRDCRHQDRLHVLAYAVGPVQVHEHARQAAGQPGLQVADVLE
jgi:SAM-dependent methyltransferase